MAYNLPGSAWDVLGIKDHRRTGRSAHWLTRTGQLGRSLTAGVQLSAVVHGPESVSADRSEPLEVMVDPIDDRDPIETDSLLPRHGVVAVP
jgi:hypothetical protein